MSLRFLLPLCILFSNTFSVFCQEDKILSASQDFFTYYQQKDSVKLNALFIPQTAFWDYLNHSYIMGNLNDSLAARSKNQQYQLHQSWWKDIKLSWQKASDLYKIKWEGIQNVEYVVKYEERSSSGFMFQSYTVTISFQYKKNKYFIVVDGFVPIGEKVCLLANGMEIKSTKY